MNLSERIENILRQPLVHPAMADEVLVVVQLKEVRVLQETSSFFLQ